MDDECKHTIEKNRTRQPCQQKFLDPQKAVRIETHDTDELQETKQKQPTHFYPRAFIQLVDQRDEQLRCHTEHYHVTARAQVDPKSTFAQLNHAAEHHPPD